SGRPRHLPVLARIARKHAWPRSCGLEARRPRRRALVISAHRGRCLWLLAFAGREGGLLPPATTAFALLAFDRTAVACQILASATAWQAALREPAAISCGVSLRQRAKACGQRGWKAQPGGGSTGLGISPSIGLRCRPLMARSGTASISMRE